MRPWRAPVPGATVERFGALVRVTGRETGFVESERDLGLTGADLDAAIALHRDHFARRGEAVEWKTRAHDRPADLVEHLVAAGFRPEQPETVLIGAVAQMVTVGSAPEGVVIRRTRERRDFEAIAALRSEVWGDDRGRLADELAVETAADPQGYAVLVAEHAGTVVSAAWVEVKRGTEFACLWGGSTLPAFRHRGVYRALVAERARVAAELGAHYLQVDASSDSRPILERLGFVAVTTTTPYVWTPR